MCQGHLLSCSLLWSDEPAADHESVLPGRVRRPTSSAPGAGGAGTCCSRGANGSASLCRGTATAARLGPTHRGFSQRTAAGSRLQTTEQGGGPGGAKAALASFKTMVFTVFHSILYDSTAGFLKEQPETSAAAEQSVRGGAWAAGGVGLITF